MSQKHCRAFEHAHAQGVKFILVRRVRKSTTSAFELSLNNNYLIYGSLVEQWWISSVERQLKGIGRVMAEESSRFWK